MQALLGQRPLTLAQWLAVLAAPVLLFTAEEARKTVIRRYRRLVAGPTGPAMAPVRTRTAPDRCTSMGDRIPIKPPPAALPPRPPGS